ncbi:MAG: hypothetical protein ACXVJT_02335 [Thermoanaerobaculia bacterium]
MITAALLLSAVHAVFLWHRVVDDSLTEPRVLARWLAAALVLALFLVVRRSCSRRAMPALLVLWLLVALLHAAVPAGDWILNARGDLSLILQTGLAAVPAGLLLAALLVASTARDRRTGLVAPAYPSFACSLPAGSPDASRAPPTR